MFRRSRGCPAGRRSVAGEDERHEHEQERSDRDQEHHAEDRARLRDEVAVAVERSGEIEAQHPGASVRTERLRRDERREERERAPDEERVLAVRDEVVDRDVLGEHREEHGGERRQERDRERDRGKHLVARSAPQPEHAARRERRERQDRALGPFTQAVVGPVAEIEQPCVLGAHSPARRYTSSSVRPRGASRRRPTPSSATASRTAS